MNIAPAPALAAKLKDVAATFQSISADLPAAAPTAYSAIAERMRGASEAAVMGAAELAKAINLDMRPEEEVVQLQREDLNPAEKLFAGGVMTAINSLLVDMNGMVGRQLDASEVAGFQDVMALAVEGALEGAALVAG